VFENRELQEEDEGATRGKCVVTSCMILTAHRVCSGAEMGGGMWHVLVFVEITLREENS
jgi:hypothetical protein